MFSSFNTPLLKENEHLRSEIAKLRDEKERKARDSHYLKDVPRLIDELWTSHKDLEKLVTDFNTSWQKGHDITVFIAGEIELAFNDYDNNDGDEISAGRMLSVQKDREEVESCERNLMESRRRTKHIASKSQICVPNSLKAKKATHTMPSASRFSLASFRNTRTRLTASATNLKNSDV